MNQDALERLRNRAKPSVEHRDLSVSPTVTPTPQDTSASENLDPQISNSADISTNLELETKQTTLRLEKALSSRLSQLCHQENISREVFLESLFLYFEEHKSIQAKVFKQAQLRDRHRHKIANYRRAKSMFERFGSM